MTSIRVYGAWCVLLILTALALPAGATTIVMPSDEELIAKTPVIVRGTVVRSAPVQVGERIQTETVLAVEESLKGRTSAEVIIRESGGTIGDREAVVFGTPDYQVGESVLVFLWPAADGSYQTMDLFVGKFSEEWTIDGQRLWYRDPAVPNVQLLDEDFEPIEDVTMQRDADRFGEFVRARARGLSGNRNYGVRSPRLVKSFQQNFTMISEPKVYRWFAFQDGKSVEWRGIGSQAGYSNGGADDSQTAISVWSDYAEADIRYVWAGMSSAAPGGLDNGNGVNEIIFEDPLNEISGSWNGSSGVVGLGGFNRISGARSWTSPFGADSSHPAKNYSAYDITEGNLVIQDGVSAAKGISQKRFAEILAHELGHTLGFGHSTSASALMYSSVTGIGPSLRDDDQVAARWLYPAAGGNPTPQVPAAPSQLVAHALSTTSVRLSWNDNSNAETAQRVWMDAGSGFAVIQTISANVEQVDVSGLQSGKSYGFRITAVGSAGESQPSNTASVTLASDNVSAAFSVSPSSGTAGVTTFQFTDQSSGPVASWHWSFGDGTIATSRNASHVYGGAGTYTVTLTVRSSSGKQSSTSRSVSVSPHVQPVSAAFSFTPSTGTAGSTTFQFSDQSTGPIASWQWSFGDGAGSTSRNPSHVYASSGNFTVTLTVNGSSGQQSSTSRQVAVGTPATPAVVAAFDLSASSIREGETIAFYDRSNGSPTWWQWSFGDGASSTSRNPSHKYVQAGTYQVVLKSGNGSSSSTATRTVQVGSASARFQSLVPVTTAISGVGGTAWRTDLTVYNASAFGVGVTARYLPAAGQQALTRGFTLGAGQSASWQNVLADLFGVADGAGAISFETESTSGTPALRISSRTYTNSAHGTYGQFVGDLPGSSVSARLHLAGLAQTSASRTNIGLVNRSGSAVQSALTLYHSNGSVLGTRNVSVLPGFQQQSLPALFPIVTSAPQGEMSLTIVSSSADAVTAYASIIDNVSQDPVYVAARPAESDREIYVAAVGRTSGSAGTYWRSDLTLSNPGSSSISATVRFLRAGQDNRFTGGRTLQLGAHGTRTITDVMSWLGAGEGTGALQITWSGNSEGLVATSRTFTTRGFDSGTLGQSIAAAAANDLTSRAVVTGLRNDGSFRANVGLVNGGQQTIGVTLRLMSPSGQQVGSAFVQLAPQSQTQASIAQLFPNAPATMPSFTVIAETPTPTMLAYGSVIDNKSGDPIFISGN